MLKRNVGRLFIGFLGICSSLLTSLPAYAAKDINVNVGIETTADNYETRGIDYPTQVHDVTKDGYYYFSGDQENTDLYTNKLITGKSSYQVVVKNKSETEDLYLKILGEKKRVAAGTTLVFNVTTSAGNKFPIFFYSPCYFEGHIG